MTKTQTIRTLVGSTGAETDRKQGLVERLRTSPIPDGELLDNIGLYLTRQTLSRYAIQRDPSSPLTSYIVVE